MSVPVKIRDVVFLFFYLKGPACDIYRSKCSAQLVEDTCEIKLGVHLF